MLVLLVFRVLLVLRVLLVSLVERGTEISNLDKRSPETSGVIPMPFKGVAGWGRIDGRTVGGRGAGASPTGGRRPAMQDLCGVGGGNVRLAFLRKEIHVRRGAPFCENFDKPDTKNKEETRGIFWDEVCDSTSGGCGGGRRDPIRRPLCEQLPPHSGKVISELSSEGY